MIRNISAFLFLIIISTSLFAQITQEWVRRYHNDGEYGGDEARFIIVDKYDNVYVTGLSYDNTSHYDFLTVKYTTSGEEKWIARYNRNFGADVPHGIVIDSEGNIYVAGECRVDISEFEYAAVKYDSKTGDTIWVRTYDNPQYFEDRALAIAIDAHDNIYVTGTSGTLKYNTSGVQQWYLPDVSMNSIAVDKNFNVYVTGLNYSVKKYSQSCVQIWNYIYGGQGCSFAFDDSDNVYITGFTGTGGYRTIKINPHGDVKWLKIYQAQIPLMDFWPKIVLDKNRNVYLGGTCSSSSSNFDYLLVKYSPEGAERWIRKYNGPLNDEDYGIDIAIDSSDCIYITGGSIGNYDMIEYTTLKYDSLGTLLWTKRYINGAPGRAFAIALGSNRNVFITGGSVAGGPNTEYCTIKYSQPIGIQPISSEVPKEFSLSQNYPNPFNPTTRIKFDIPQEGTRHGAFVQLKVFDILGREIYALVNERLSPGTYEVQWDASNYPSGVYFYRLVVSGAEPLITENYSDTKRMVLIK